jgi:hypothetical protein
MRRTPWPSHSRSQPERLASDGADPQHPASESGSATLPRAVGNFGAGADDASSLAARKAGGEQQEVTVSAAAERRSAEAGEADLAGTTLMGRADDYGQDLPGAAAGQLAQVGDSDDGDVPGL